VCSEWAAYVTRSMEKHLEEMLEVTVPTWLALLAIVGLTIPLDLSPVHAIYAFAISGWVVLFLTLTILYASDDVLSQLVAHTHVLRRKAKFLANYQPTELQAVEKTVEQESSANSAQAQLSHRPSGRETSSRHVGEGGVNKAARLALEGEDWSVPRDKHAVRLEELSAAVQTQKTPSLMTSLCSGMDALRKMQCNDDDDGFDDGEEQEREEGEAGAPNSPPSASRTPSDRVHVEAGRGCNGHGGKGHSLCTKLCEGLLEAVFGSVAGECVKYPYGKPPPGGRLLAMLPGVLQICMLLACILQALVITMLGRDDLLLLSAKGEAGPEDKVDFQGGWRGTLLIVLTLTPTIIQSLLVSPRVLRNISLANASAHQDRQVLHELETEFEQSGDYVAANEALEIAAGSKLTDEDLHDEGMVRAKVKDLIKLGEMRWRYRVVDEGQSPKEEAIKLLSEAKELIESHCSLMAEKKAKPTRTCLSPSSPSHSRMGVLMVAIPREWASEMSEVLQGLALARLIFNQERGEDALISALLKAALDLREDMRDAAKMADTLNSIGSLRQKQHNFKDAEANFAKSLELRREMAPSEGSAEGFEKVKAQAVAQSLTSLGSLFLQMADQSEPKSDEGLAEERRAERKAEHRAHLVRALRHLHEAKEMYIKGFNPEHPKVAWALEGLAKAHQKNGDFREAQTAWEEAIAIRNVVQESSSGKQMFSAELAHALSSQQEVAQRRTEARRRLQIPLKKRLAAALMLRPEAIGDALGSSLAQPFIAGDIVAPLIAPQPPLEAQPQLDGGAGTAPSIGASINGSSR